MRKFNLLFALLATLGLAQAAAAVSVASPALSGLALAEGGTLDVKVDVGSSSDAWFTNPLWIAVGIVGIILIVALIAMAARGGGSSTTVIKD